MSTQPVATYTAAEYLAQERCAETKHEYYAGEIFAMSGASRAHNLIAWALSTELGKSLNERPCEAYQSDMRVKVDRTGLYTYPDAVVTCDEPRFEDDHVDTLLNPQAVFEILSESTEKHDRGKKFDHYRHVESLQDYVLISQEEPLVEVYSRQDDGTWNLSIAKGLDASIMVPAIDVPLRLQALYARVQFDTPS
ncbi:MAG: Uma2 family endonuclease [Planctomycetota bacterium]